VELADDVAPGILDAGFRPLVVQNRRARTHRFFGIENCRKDLVVDADFAAAFLGRGFTVGNHGGDALAGKTRNPVQKNGVVGIDAFVLVPGGRIEFCRYIFIRQNCAHARNRQCVILADRFDPSMRVR